MIPRWRAVVDALLCPTPLSPTEPSSSVPLSAAAAGVWVPAFAGEAIAREKQLKRWKRDWKIELIERENLEWRDLSDLIV